MERIPKIIKGIIYQFWIQKHEPTFGTPFASLSQARALFTFNPLAKGKPSERMGRKGTGLSPHVDMAASLPGGSQPSPAASGTAWTQLEEVLCTIAFRLVFPVKL